MNAYVIGDIHGRATALKEVLKKSGFRKEIDKLICLGDVVDGGMETKECVDILLNIYNLTYIFGNHDIWFLGWMNDGTELPAWYHQGGINTIKSYGHNHNLIPVTHQDFFNSGKGYYVMNNMLFVHGGFNPNIPIRNQDLHDLVWDRDLIKYASRQPIEKYKYVFIGHTSTQLIAKTTKPIMLNNLICLDTGAGFSGKLTIMDINTRKYWQSIEQVA